jgi:heat shock protein HslJ
MRSRSVLRHGWLVLAVLTGVVGCSAGGAGGAGGEASGGVASSGGAGGLSTRAPRAGLETPESLTLAGPTWRWVETRMGDGTRIAAPRTGSADLFSVTFAGQAVGTASVTADCNSGSGPYATDGVSLLVIGPLVMTDAACAEGSESERFVEHLHGATSYVIQEGRLHVGLSASGGADGGTGTPGQDGGTGAGIMVLEPLENPVP